MSIIETKNWNLLTRTINEAEIILLSTHINPDGDGLGSEIAFYYYLNNLGKECRIINPSDLPYNCEIIDPDKIVETYDVLCDEWLESVELMVVFDIGDFNRTGIIGEKVRQNSTLVCIDHHPPKDDHPFDINIIDIEAPATGYMLWKYFQHINYIEPKLSLKIANGLYASVVTDTGSFKYQSTTSDTHIMAAYLLECGVDGYDIQRSIYEQQPISQVNLLGKVISNLKFSKHGKVVWTIITQDMLLEANASDDDAGGFTEYLRMIENVEVSFMIRVKNNKHRINFRSSGNVIINDIAKSFGGGGHKFAAGAHISDMKTEIILQNITQLLNKKLPGEFDVN
jgi:phosphoesterase RecJ-like protein